MSLVVVCEEAGNALGRLIQLLPNMAPKLTDRSWAP